MNCMLLSTSSHRSLRDGRKDLKFQTYAKKEQKCRNKLHEQKHSHTLTSSMRLVSWPMLSGRALSLLLLALRTRRGRPHTHTGNTDSWLRLSITETMGSNVKSNIRTPKISSLCFSLLKCSGSKLCKKKSVFPFFFDV